MDFLGKVVLRRISTLFETDSSMDFFVRVVLRRISTLFETDSNR